MGLEQGWILLSYSRKSTSIDIMSPTAIIRASKTMSDPIIRIYPTRKNRVLSQNLCLNLKFRQPAMSEFKSESGLSSGIRVRVVWIFEPF